MKYCVNRTEQDDIFYMCGRLEVKLSKNCACIHRAYLHTIIVIIFSVVASINFASPYYATQ